MLKNKLVVCLYFVEQFRNTLFDLVWTSIAQAVQNIKKTDRIHGLFTLNSTQCTIAQPLRISRSGVRVPFGVPIKDGVNASSLRLLFMHWNRDSNYQIAICRWHIAATSSKTGCYLNFCPSPARAKMQTSPFRRTRKADAHSGICFSFLECQLTSFMRQSL